MTFLCCLCFLSFGTFKTTMINFNGYSTSSFTLWIALGIFYIITDTCLFSGHVLALNRLQLRSLSSYSIFTPYYLKDGNKTRIFKKFSSSAKYVSIVVPVNQTDVILDLQINRQLFPDGYLERSYLKDNTVIKKIPKKEHNCFYHGDVRSVTSSRVVISICRGISGVIWLPSETYYIDPVDGTGDTDHVIYKRINQVHQRKECNNSLKVKPDTHQRIFKKERIKRNVLHETKYVELLLIASYSVYRESGNDEEAVRERLKRIANYMDMIWKALNFRIALVDVEIWTTEEQIEIGQKLGTTLTNFNKWRKNNMHNLIKHDHAQLFVDGQFTDRQFGMAKMHHVCSSDGSAGVVVERGNHDNDIAFTMAHEFGHNIGFEHNGAECVCPTPERGCVMDEWGSETPTFEWSSCSRHTLEESLRNGFGACFFDYPHVIYDGPICGNAFLEEGEECDCGSQEDCENECCNTTTCRLQDKAECAMGECCHKCNFKCEGDPCREAVDRCDLPEFCSGNSETCPPNVYIQNGASCEEPYPGVCFDGSCVSLNNQCEALWGEGAIMSESVCSRYNTQGNMQGNCGVGENGNYIRCSNRNKNCGKLYCKGGGSNPLLDAIALSHTVTFKGSECKVVSVDHGAHTSDPGYVETGSPCGNDKFCHDFECKTLADIGLNPCPTNCSGRGVCNSKNHCHCDNGWAPPNCSEAGLGGSIDSGPATIEACSTTILTTGTTHEISTMPTVTETAPYVTDQDTTSEALYPTSEPETKTPAITTVTPKTLSLKPTPTKKSEGKLTTIKQESTEKLISTKSMKEMISTNTTKEFVSTTTTKEFTSTKPIPTSLATAIPTDMSFSISIFLAVSVLLIFFFVFVCCNKKGLIRTCKGLNGSRSGMVIINDDKTAIPLE